MKFRKNPFLWLIIFMAVIGFACMSSVVNMDEAIQESTEIAASPMPPATKAAATDEARQSKPEKLTETIEPTTPPTAAPTQAVESLTLFGDVGLIQGEDSIMVTVAFLVNNPNTAYGIERSEYQVRIYDQNDVLIETDTGYLELVLPGETHGVVRDLYLEEGQAAERVEVFVTSGKPGALEVGEDVFGISQETFIADPYFPSVTGVIRNGLNFNITNLKVTALLFDEAGKIVGGGYTYLNFLAPASEAGVDIHVNVSGKPADVKIYPAVSWLSSFEDRSTEPPALEIVAEGSGQDDREVGVGFIIQNNSPDQAVRNSEYQIAVYGETGNVLASSEGYIELVYPGEQQAIFDTMYLPEGTTRERVVIQLNEGEKEAVDLDETPFSSDNLYFAPDEYFARLTGIVSNSHNKFATNVEVVALAYDAEGEIIGGGYQYADFIPAEGSIPVNVSLTLEGKPESFGLFAAHSGLSSFKASPPDGLIEIIQLGFGQTSSSAGVAFLLENTDQDEVVHSSEYRIALYDDAGIVIGVDTGYLPILFPGQQTGFATSVYMLDNMDAVRVEVQIYPGELRTSSLPSLPLTVSDIQYVSSSYSPKATGVLHSSHTESFDSTRVYAIAYDAAGNIIGGGSDYIFDELLPEGSIALEIYLYTAGVPDRIEIYPAVSSLD